MEQADFQEAFEEKCPWIQPVFDYFHIVKNFNDKVVSAVRKDEQRRLYEEGLVEEARALKKTRYILMSSRSTLQAKDAQARAGKPIARSGSLFPKVFAGGLAVAAFVFIRQKTRSTPLMPIWDGVIPLLICWFMHDYVNRIPVLSKGLEVLGIYSMNMFLLHNFVRIVWYYDFTYQFRNWLVIILVLLVISLGLAMLVEGLKKAIRYERFIDQLTGKS